MRKTLAMDAVTREMRLVYTDLWEGQHERTEYRVTSDRTGGHVVRNMPELAGTPVLGTVPGLYIQGPGRRRSAVIWTEQTAVGPTVRTPCARAASARRKCALCVAA